MRQEREKDRIAYFLRALPTWIDIHMLSNAYTIRFSTTYPYSLDISTFTAISSYSIRLTSERFLNNKNYTTLIIVRLICYLSMGLLSYIVSPLFFGDLFSRARSRSECDIHYSWGIRRRWRCTVYQLWVFQELLGVYPLRYLNFCVTDVAGAYSGERRGPVIFFFKMRAELIWTLKIFQKVTQSLRYLRGCEFSVT